MARVPLHVAYRRALTLKCPRCGEGDLFATLFRMHERCSACGVKYERDPGYFLGSIYVNYGWTAFSMSAAYILLHIVCEYENIYVVPPLMIYVVLFPMFFHRYARSLWMAMDCQFDQSTPEG